jgi:pimeloyl-ACP methyl ester carboxylesterase
MSEFVLVHGSYHGGWVWEAVAADLRDAGYEVHAPTMTGLGERSHLIAPYIGLSVHIEDIVRTLECRDLTDVVLVGHSYGGLVITGVAEACAERLVRLVYLDGFVPEDGESAWDIAPDAQEAWEARMAATGTEWLVLPPDPADKYGETGSLADWHREQLTPMSMWTHEEPIRLPENRAAELPRSYIECTEYRTFRHMGEKARDGEFDYHRLETHHNPILYMPELVSERLLSIVDSD